MSMSLVIILTIYGFFIIGYHGLVKGNPERHKYCIIGAGPSGLQLGHYLQEAGRDYIIFEKGNQAGTFYETYPRHGVLISINKRHTGSSNTEFNMRHDWNSLLSNNDSLLFGRYSKEMFPPKEALVRYLNDYQKYLNIKVKFNTEISDISEVQMYNEKKFTMRDQRGERYVCQILTVATGFYKPFLPAMKGLELTVGYENVSTNPQDFEGKNVLILGKGNSAFEVAASIYGSTNVIHLISRNRIRLAWATHYVGDLRAVNNALLDTYQLKSLDGILESNLEKENSSFVRMPSGKIRLLSGSFIESAAKISFSNSDLVEYDTVVRCLGWIFDKDIFNSSSMHIESARVKKYPLIKSDYQSPQYENLYFIGTIAHSVDFRKAAGGFIHGFRYVSRMLHHLHEVRYENVPWPNVRRPTTSLVDHFIRRVNEGSGTYQMFGVLGDIAIMDEDNVHYTFIEEYPVKQLAQLEKNTGIKVPGKVIVFVFEYGMNFSGPGKDPFAPDRASSSLLTPFESNFLHPVYYHYHKLPTDEEMMVASKNSKLPMPRPTSLCHSQEDFNTNFRKMTEHVLPLLRFLEDAFNLDLTEYSSEACLVHSLSSMNLPLSCSLGQSRTSYDFIVSQ